VLAVPKNQRIGLTHRLMMSWRVGLSRPGNVYQQEKAVKSHGSMIGPGSRSISVDGTGWNSGCLPAEPLRPQRDRLLLRLRPES